MKFFRKIPYIIVAGYSWIVIISSCANQGMPTGGPRDTIPPVLVSTQPRYKSLNFRGDEIRLTFDEFIIPDQVAEILVISPPLEKRPTILTRSKTLIVRFNERLRESVTYSLDFKNSIVDNNERNPYENLRFSFSTGNILDTLRVAGKVVNGFNLEPVEKTLVVLHKNLHDSAVYRHRPDYIARTDNEGLFLFDNLAEGKYHIFALTDMNNDLMYNEGAEQIAFHDSIIVPSAEYHAEPDTLSTGADSLLVAGHIHFYPGPVYLRQFTEKIFDQFLKTFKRDSRFRCTFVFNESVRNSFALQLIDDKTDDWYLLEPNQNFDSLTVWITDTTLTAKENITMELSYMQLDSLNHSFIEKDTVVLQFTEREIDTRKRRRDREEEEEEIEPVPQFTWSTNISSTAFDLNRDILITSPQPVAWFDSTAVTLFRTGDTLKTPLSFRFARDTLAWRTYRLSFPWVSETGYTLEIDSAACRNIYGITSHKLLSNFKTRSRDYYGIINLDITGVEGQILIQLLENNNAETFITQKEINEDQRVTFDYLPPGKYRVKVVYDDNRNGKWDTGSFQDKIQPERVSYINEVIRVRSNWDSNFLWNLERDPTYYKDIRDRELEEQQRKEAEDKARQEQQFGPSQQQNNMLRQGGTSPGSIQPDRW